MRYFSFSRFHFLRLPTARALGLSALASGLLIASAVAADARPIRGRVVLPDGAPAHHAEVLLVELGRITHSDDDGSFAFDGVDREGSITLHAHLGFLSAEVRLQIPPGGDSSEEETVVGPITLEARSHAYSGAVVTASVAETSPFDVFNSTQSIEGVGLVNRGATTVADLLESEPGVAVRSFGPGSARPVIRGFDGDRVLVMEDGVRTGDLGSQSADHGVPIDPTQTERIEVVRGPATLLYGSNAIGGTVNAISMREHLGHRPPPGFSGHATFGAGTVDDGTRGGARFQAVGRNWAVWGGGSANRTDDYEAPNGLVENSATRMTQGEAGIGLFSERTWFSISGRIDDARYGVPFAGEFHGHGEEEHGEDEHGEDEHGEDEHGEDEDELHVDVGFDRRQLRTDFGVRDFGLPLFEEAAFTFRFSDYNQDELETLAAGGADEVATHFDNRSLVFRGELKSPTGPVHSRLGVWAHLRDYAAMGEEALAPETTQTAYAVFTYNEFHVSDRAKLLLGARLERNEYEAGARPELEEHGHEGEEDDHEGEEDDHEGEEEGHEGEEEGHEGEEEEHHGPEPADPRNRDFLGPSGSLGLRFDLTDAVSLVGTGSFATRAPALEELYNFGPHVGNLAFEVGDPSLERETSRGFDLSLRTESSALSASINGFWYDIDGYIFGVATGELEDGLQVLDFTQADARYHGFELEGTADLGPASLHASVSFVDAVLTGTDEDLPRIPPLGGNVEIDIPVRGLHISPRLRWAARMDRVHPGETETDGYALFDLTASYVLVASNAMHNFALSGTNLADAEYRHHTSLIKDLAAQPGRGLRLTYTLRFF